MSRPLWGLLLHLLAVLCALPLAARAAETAAQDRGRGKQAFAHRCAMCHREGNTGTFVLARRLGNDKALLEQRTDLVPAYIRLVVRQGLLNMPRISRVELPDSDLEAITRYLASPGP